MRTRPLLLAIVSIAVCVCALEAQRGRVMPDGVVRDRAMFHYRAGLENLRAEDWDKAAIAFQNAIDTDSSFEMAYYGLGRAHMGGRKFPDAVAALTKCRDLYAAQSGRRFSNLQDVQRYRRDQMMEIDEILRQYSTGPQTARSAETVRQLGERKRQLQETISAIPTSRSRTPFRHTCRYRWGAPTSAAAGCATRSGNTRRRSRPMRRVARR